jgi:putative hydrolase of the HAD superfamily
MSVQINKLLDSIDLLCVDMFQTLVDVKPRIPFIWKRILQEQYTPELAESCFRLVQTKIITPYHEITGQLTGFQNLKTLFKPYFKQIKEELRLDYDEEDATLTFLVEQGHSVSFPDTRPFFDGLNGRLPVCLISDTDDDMIQPLLRQYTFDKVFTSENTRSYKSDPRGTIFKTVLNHYNLAPERVLHVGDAISDIKGAKSLSIQACWINRNGSEWSYDIKPDYVIQKLTDLA